MMGEGMKLYKITKDDLPPTRFKTQMEVASKLKWLL
jgi:hypothetical protein